MQLPLRPHRLAVLVGGQWGIKLTTSGSTARSLNHQATQPTIILLLVWQPDRHITWAVFPLLACLVFGNCKQTILGVLSMSVVPVIIRALGTISRNFTQYYEQLQLNLFYLFILHIYPSIPNRWITSCLWWAYLLFQIPKRTHLDAPVFIYGHQPQWNHSAGTLGLGRKALALSPLDSSPDKMFSLKL